jgi:hypothetical protein
LFCDIIFDRGGKYGKAGGMRVGRAARINSSTIGEIYSRTIRLFPNNSMDYASVPVALQIISMIPPKLLEWRKKYTKKWR